LEDTELGSVYGKLKAAEKVETRRQKLEMGMGRGEETEPIRISAFPGEGLRKERPPAGMPALPGRRSNGKFI
jgi:hypothetical protein